MTDQHEKDKDKENVGRPHGETGDTVRQAAEVSKPTSSIGRVLDEDGEARVPPGTTTGTGTSPVQPAATKSLSR